MGETGQPLHYPMNGHRFDISHGRTIESLVAAHFTSGEHTHRNRFDGNDEILTNVGVRTPFLERLDSRWIRTLDTSWLPGIHLRADGPSAPVFVRHPDKKIKTTPFITKTVRVNCTMKRTATPINQTIIVK